MIKNFLVQNFKAFKEKQNIPLKPITLVFGQNSAGKSSIMQSIFWTLGAKISGDLDYGMRGQESDKVSFKSFKDILFKKDKRNALSLQFEYDSPKGLKVTYEIGLPNSDVIDKIDEVGKSRVTSKEIRRYNDLHDRYFDLEEEKRSEWDGYAAKDSDGNFLEDEKGDFIYENPDWNEEKHQEKWKPILEKAWNNVHALIKEAKRTGLGDEVDLWEKKLWGEFEKWNQDELAILMGYQLEFSEEVLFRFERRTAASRTNLELVWANRILIDAPEEIDSLLNFDGKSYNKEALINSDQYIDEAELKGIINLEFTGLNPFQCQLDDESKGPKRIGKNIKSILDKIVKSLRTISTDVSSNGNIYLGPLRTLPPRNFINFEDLYPENLGDIEAWKALRDNPKTIDSLNEWLGASKFDIDYKFQLHSYYESQVLSEVDYGGGSIQHFDFSKKYGERPKRLYTGSDIDEYKSHAQDIAEANPEINDYDHPLSHEKLRSKFFELMGKGHMDLALIDTKNNTTVTHKDVGVGLSQMIPVVVSCVQSENKIVAVEQPEIHLHPALQSKMGDLFIESAKKDNGNKLLLETHSEHLILRILRRIRETAAGELPEGMHEIRPEDVCILYVQRTEDGSEVIEIPVTEDGDFGRAWPNGFFTERSEELF